MAVYRHKVRAGVALALFPLLIGATDDGCRLCSASPEKPGATAQTREALLSIEITTNLDFSKAALTGTGGGQISLDPDSGTRQVRGLVDLGGYPMAGSATVRGEPGRSVRIDMPSEIRMSSSTGGSISISDLQTDLPPAPRLDSSGQLRFRFGGRLDVSGNVSGTFRGRFPITANYE